MKAIFYILSPVEFFIPEDIHLKPQIFNIDGYKISIFEPAYVSLEPGHAIKPGFEGF